VKLAEAYLVDATVEPPREYGKDNLLEPFLPIDGSNSISSNQFEEHSRLVIPTSFRKTTATDKNNTNFCEVNSLVVPWMNESKRHRIMKSVLDTTPLL